MRHAAIGPGGMMRRILAAKDEHIGLAGPAPFLDPPVTSAIAGAEEPASAQASVSRTFVLTASMTFRSSRAALTPAAKRDRSTTRLEVVTSARLAASRAGDMGGFPHSVYMNHRAQYQSG